jgi:hypothetical protein
MVITTRELFMSLRAAGRFTGSGSQRDGNAPGCLIIVGVDTGSRATTRLGAIEDMT